MSKDLFPKHVVLELSKINVKEEKSMINNFEGSQRKQDSSLQRNTHQADGCDEISQLKLQARGE